MRVEEHDVAEGTGASLGVKWVENGDLDAPGVYDKVTATSIWDIGEEGGREEGSGNANLGLESDRR